MGDYTKKQKEQILQQVENLFDSRSPLEIRDAILEFQQVYMINQCDCLPFDIERISENFYMLSEFLKTMEKIIKGDPTYTPD
jgi:hypothetical protein